MLFYDGFAFPQATGMLFLVSGVAAASLRLSLEEEARAEVPTAPEPVSGRRSPAP
jgi:hypothetical protein